MKNGFVLGCETTREGVVIDPGDDVELLLEAVAAARPVDRLHPADARAPRPHHRRRRAPRRRSARRSGCTATTTFSTRRSCSRGMAFGFRVEPPAAGGLLLRRSGPVALRRVRGVGASHAGPLSRRRLPGRRPRRSRRAHARSSATRCSPDRSAAPICRAAISRRCCDRSARCSSAFPTRRVVLSGHGEPTTIGREKRTNPFLV